MGGDRYGKGAETETETFISEDILLEETEKQRGSRWMRS